jgi:hypothetical protein
MKARVEHGDFIMVAYEDNNSKKPEPESVASLRNTNLFSLATIVISLILLILFFLLPQASL